MSKSEISDAGLVYLKDLTNLQWLDLAETKVTDAGLVHLMGMTKLMSRSRENARSSTWASPI